MAGFSRSSGKLKRPVSGTNDREQMKREQMKREPMKTLSQQANKISREISRDLAAYRDAFRAWLNDAASKFFPTPAPVRVVTRQENQSPIRRRP
jgi:hypothetical protein